MERNENGRSNLHAIPYDSINTEREKWWNRVKAPTQKSETNMRRNDIISIDLMRMHCVASFSANEWFKLLNWRLQRCQQHVPNFSTHLAQTLSTLCSLFLWHFLTQQNLPVTVTEIAEQFKQTFAHIMTTVTKYGIIWKRSVAETRMLWMREKKSRRIKIVHCRWLCKSISFSCASH